MANNGLHTPPHTVSAGVDTGNETPDRNDRSGAPSPSPTKFTAYTARRANASMSPAASDEEVVEWAPSSPESPSPDPRPRKEARQGTAAPDIRPSIEVPMGTSLEAVMMLPTQGPSETSEEPKVPDNDDDKDDDKDIREGNREDSEKTTVKKCVAVKKRVKQVGKRPADVANLRESLCPYGTCFGFCRPYNHPPHYPYL